MRFFLFSLSAWIILLPLSPLSAQKKEGGKEPSSIQLLRALPGELPGGEFVRFRAAVERGGANSFYRGPNGMQLNLYLEEKKSPPVTLEKAYKRKLLFVEKMRDPAGKKIPGSWIIKRQARSFPGLAGKNLTGIRMQARIGQGQDAGRLDIFLAIYRDRLLQISFLLPESALPARIQERIFFILLSGVSQILYTGEKAPIAPFRRELFFKAFAKLMQEPEKAALESHAIKGFIERSSAVLVNIDPRDFPWQKELSGRGAEGKKAFALLLTAYMGGNAAEQLQQGICRDRREAGIKTMKKMYLLLRKKNLLSLQIPELEK